MGILTFVENFVLAKCYSIYKYNVNPVNVISIFFPLLKIGK